MDTDSEQNADEEMEEEEDDEPKTKVFFFVCAGRNFLSVPLQQIFTVLTATDSTGVHWLFSGIEKEVVHNSYPSFDMN